MLMAKNSLGPPWERYSKRNKQTIFCFVIAKFYYCFSVFDYIHYSLILFLFHIKDFPFYVSLKENEKIIL